MIKNHFANKTNRLLLAIILLSGSLVSAQTGINGVVILDTSKWAPIAYLSIIPDFSQLNTMSYENIIERSELDENGQFQFITEYLSAKDLLYRIHFSKKGDPPASLIIGGKDHNHFFFIANQKSEIEIKSGGGRNLFNNLTIKGYQPNQGLADINNIIGLLDTLDYFGSAMNREFIREAVNEKIKIYADTCSHPIVASYALYKIGYEQKKTSDWLLGWLIALVILLSISGIWMIFKRRQKLKKNPLSELTIQERKIFALLKEGKSNKEIADDCSISVSTVKSHTNNVYSKLGVSSRKEVLDL